MLLILGGPVRLTAVVWLAVLALYYLGPIEYTKPPEINVWLFLAASLLIFAVGTWIGRATAGRLPRAVAPPTRRLGALGQRLDLMVGACALLGLVGIVCIAVDKVFVTGIDYSAGLAAFRYERAASSYLGLTDAPPSLLLYVGQSTISFAVVAYAFYLLMREHASPRA